MSDELSVLARLVTGVFVLEGSRAAVYLTLPIPVPPRGAVDPRNHPWDEWVRCRLEADTVEDAQLFVAEVAEALELAPAVRTKRKVRLTYNWRLHKMTLESGEDRAEVYIELGEGARTVSDLFATFGHPHTGSLRPKDEAYASTLGSLMLDALTAHLA